MASQRKADRDAHRALRSAGLACVAAIALSACSSKPALPSNFEVIGKTSTDAGDIYTVRDGGTGCEFIQSSAGLLPRNERSADGTAVKQRCVITGDEAPAPAGVQQFDQGAQAPSAAQPAFAPQATQANPDAQEQALREAIREQTAGAIPPAAPAAETPAIPPPRGARRPAAQPATAQPPQDGVESQLK